MSAPTPEERAAAHARTTYRRHRLIDAAGLLPALGALFFVLPLLWVGAGGGAPRTSYVMLYLFAVWALLVALSALVTWRLGPGTEPPGGDERLGEDGPGG